MKKPDPRQLIENSGLFKQDSFDWILEIILSNKDASYGSIDKKIRTVGELMSADEMLKLGLRATAKVSNKYYLSLSDKGKEDISFNSARFLICHYRSVILTIAVACFDIIENKTIKDRLDRQT